MRIWLLSIALALMAGLAAYSSAERRVVLGRFGQAMEATRIFAAPNTKARVFYRLPAYQYLVVRSSRNKGWLQVLMSNGAWGFVPEPKVAVLPYEVVDRNSGSRASRSSTGSRGGAARGALANYALNYTGTPYQWGGNDMRSGVDCSAFVKNLFGRIGVNLPRTAAQQALVGKPIARYEDLKPGDRLYFWEERRNTIGHTGIYLGNGYFVHSSRGRGGVATDFLGAPKWRNSLVSARR